MKDDKMALPTGVFLRGGVYWLRVLIPDDLRHLYPRTGAGKLATDRHRASLRTSDPKEAKARALTLRASFESEFLERRRGLVPATIKPTAALVEILAERIEYNVLAGDDAQRYGLPEIPVPFKVSIDTEDGSPPSFEEREFTDRAVAQGLGLALASGNTSVGRRAADAVASALGLNIDWSGQEAALVRLGRVAVAAYADIARRSAGHPIETPPEPRGLPELGDDGTPKGPKYRTIRDLLPLWKRKTKPAANAVGRAEKALDLLDDSGVNAVLKTLTRSDGAQFRDWLRDSEIREFGQKTGRNHYRAVTALLNASLDYGALPVNPWRGLDFPVTDSEERPPFTREELRALFSGPVFEAYEIPEGEKTVGDAAYWVPLIGLWTGARVGEIGQLECADLREVDGVMVLDIHKRAPGSRLKTANSARLVPIHAELVRLGLLDYLKAAKDRGDVKLFPGLHRGGRRTPGEVFSEYFRDYRTERGVITPLASFHSLRHNMRSALVAAGVTEPVCDDLLGHARSGSTGRRTYTHLGLDTLSTGVGRLAYPFLQVERVYPKP